MNRYSKQILLPQVGEQGQNKIKNTSILVVGAGGLGCAVLQNLSMAGVGKITIMDGDVVQESNLHRQVLYSKKNIGEAKVVAAKNALNEINKETTIEAVNTYINSDNYHNLQVQPDLIIDCTDNLEARYLINDVSISKNIPFIYGAIHRFEGQVSVFNYQNGPSYACLFPKVQNSTPSCEQIGVLGVLPNIIGLFQANEALKIILDIGEILSGKLLSFDALTYQTNLISFEKNQAKINERLTELNAQEQRSDLEKTIDLNQLWESANNKNITKIDLRAKAISNELKMENKIDISLEALLIQLDKFDKQQEIVLFCHSGIKSKQAYLEMKKQGFSNVCHVRQGLKI